MDADLIKPALTHHDRCDREQSEQALVLLQHPNTGHRLQLCAHHFQSAAPKVLDWIILIDDRPRILGGDYS